MDNPPEVHEVEVLGMDSGRPPKYIEFGLKNKDVKRILTIVAPVGTSKAFDEINLVESNSGRPITKAEAIIQHRGKIW